MPEVKKETSPANPATKQEIILDWKAAKEHLETVKKTGFELALGKPGNNPYLWWARVGRDLEQRVKVANEKDAGLFNEIISLKIPTVDSLPLI